MTLVLTTAIQSWPQFLCTSYHVLQTWLHNMRKHVDNDDPSIMTVITILLVNTQHASNVCVHGASVTYIEDDCLPFQV